MRRKTLSIVLDAFIGLLLITIVFLIVLIVKRGEAPIEAAATQEETSPVVQTEPTVAEEEPETPEAEEPEKTGELLGRCNSDGVNVRAGTSTDYDVLGMAADGDEFKVIANYENGWTELEYKGGKGYIFSEYLDYFYMSGGEYTPVDRNEIPMAE